MVEKTSVEGEKKRQIGTVLRKDRKYRKIKKKGTEIFLLQK